MKSELAIGLFIATALVSNACLEDKPVQPVTAQASLEEPKGIFGGASADDGGLTKDEYYACTIEGFVLEPREDTWASSKEVDIVKGIADLVPEFVSTMATKGAMDSDFAPGGASGFRVEVGSVECRSSLCYMTILFPTISDGSLLGPAFLKEISRHPEIDRRRRFFFFFDNSTRLELFSAPSEDAMVNCDL